MAPAPGRNSGFLKRDLKTWTPSSMALSMSSRMLVVLPLKIIVDNLQSSVFLLKITNFSEAISSTPTSSEVPAYSGVGAYNFDRMVALTALESLLSSNLLRILTAIILYLSKKCKTISEMVPPQTATLMLALTSFCTNFSAKSSSPLE